MSVEDQPSAIELLQAVRSFIRDQAIPRLEGRAAFHARIAVNALAIVERGLELGPSHAAAERERLEALLGRTGTLEELNRELCRRIRAGEVDLETPGLPQHLRVTTLAKLAVDQPRYEAYRRAAGDAEAAEKARRLFPSFVDHHTVPGRMAPKLAGTRPMKSIGTPMITIGSAQALRDSIGLADAGEWIDRGVEEIERERRDTLAAIARRDDRLAVKVFDLFCKTHFRTHPYGLPIPDMLGEAHALLE